MIPPLHPVSKQPCLAEAIDWLDIFRDSISQGIYEAGRLLAYFTHGSPWEPCNLSGPQRLEPQLCGECEARDRLPWDPPSTSYSDLGPDFMGE